MTIKISQDLEIQLLREKYIDKNAIEIVGWAECDSKIQNHQMIAGHRSPKSFRFMLISRLQNLTLYIIENIYRANEILVQNKNLQNIQKHLEFQYFALTDIKVLAYMALLSREQGCILPKQYE